MVCSKCLDFCVHVCFFVTHKYNHIYTNKYIQQYKPLCVCGSEMLHMPAYECYGEGLSALCDGCNKDIEQSSNVFHCLKDKIAIHENGYDLCEQCGIETLKYKEFKDSYDFNYKNIVRDYHLPIHITVIHYFCNKLGIFLKQKNNHLFFCVPDLHFQHKICLSFFFFEIPLLTL